VSVTWLSCEGEERISLTTKKKRREELDTPPDRPKKKEGKGKT